MFTYPSLTLEEEIKKLGVPDKFQSHHALISRTVFAAMGKRCCRCGGSCCGCCCSKRGATVCFSLVGLALAAAVIVPPVYIYAATEDRNFGLLFPILELSKEALEHVRVLSLERINSA